MKRLAGKCHTLERFDIYECLLRNVETEEDAMLLDRYIKLRYETDHHAEIQENDECMQNHSKVSLYWQ